MGKGNSLYDLFNIDKAATEDDIKTSYQKLLNAVSCDACMRCEIECHIEF